MSTATRKSHVVIGRRHNGILMTREEFDRSTIMTKDTVTSSSMGCSL